MAKLLNLLALGRFRALLEFENSRHLPSSALIFVAAKGSLEKASQPGFYDRAATMCAQASQVIAAIKKNGSTAVALVGLIGVLDDMSLNGARASASTLLLAVGEDKRAMQDFQNIAQAEKNCYDISELLLHATIRYISAEEATLRVLLVHFIERIFGIAA